VCPDFKPTTNQFLGKKHCIYYYASGDWGLASPAQLLNFGVHLEVLEFSQAVPPEDQALFDEAVRIGRADMWENKQERVAWNHTGGNGAEGRRKTRLLKVAKTLLKYRWGEEEVSDDDDDVVM
jgi:hypothetical protein